ncbi:DUF1501 domain-containing protein [Actinokineospora cianjurensis]|uniref:DUF1501 domain-containing protein n=1 Tax=Actinokineospora cianjurensis TaxID=585224 RepID=UPI001FE98CBC|nr:hypothetical protein [Actinokineospora cianjurensis]
MTDDRGPHPDCPDLDRLGPNRAEARLRAEAARVAHDGEHRRRLWDRGFTRRRVIAGAGAAGVAALGAQLVTTRVSFGDPARKGTVVVVFLRGGMDGLSVLVPAGDPHLQAARPKIAAPAGALLPLDRGFGLHPALAPLHEYWAAGRFTAVPALSTPDLSRSHFQAQDCLERGGAATSSVSSGWLDRVLAELGPGTTFRAVGEAGTLPRSLVGSQGALALRGVEAFKIAVWDALHEQTTKALSTLYTGIDHPLAAQARPSSAHCPPRATSPRPTTSPPPTRTARSARHSPTSPAWSSPTSGCAWRASTSAAGTCTPTSAPSTAAT